MLMHPFGKGLGQTVGQRFQHDVGIVVDIGLELRQMRADTVARGDRKAADPVTVAADEIGQAHVRLAFALGNLLP